MLVFGVMGSPRKFGNTNELLSSFLDGCEDEGAKVERINISEVDIKPCFGCRFCEKEGRCKIEDDDTFEVFSLIKRADVVVVATPIFFYGPPSQLKSLIDRSQILWSRKYIFRFTDPRSKAKKGFLLAVGATRGKNLFNCVDLCARYFFDAISAKYEGMLGYREVEGPKDIKSNPKALYEANEKGKELVRALRKRKKVLFVSQKNTFKSQIAEAFLQSFASHLFEVESVGLDPGEKVSPFALKVMEEKGIDLFFRKPKGVKEVTFFEDDIDFLIFLERESGSFEFGAKEKLFWDIAQSEKSVESAIKLRDCIEEMIRTFLESYA